MAGEKRQHRLEHARVDWSRRVRIKVDGSHFTLTVYRLPFLCRLPLPPHYTVNENGER
jgi:hypothetical protein